jgi:hypothetical protein
MSQRGIITYNRAAVDAQVAELKKRGYTDDRIELAERNGTIVALPMEPRQAGPYPLPYAIREGHHE